jgi:hypothetical protein
MNLVENPLYLTKNFEGVASQPAVETLMKEYNGGWRRRFRPPMTPISNIARRRQLGKDEFREAVGKAMRRGDADADPVIDQDGAGIPRQSVRAAEEAGH